MNNLDQLTKEELIALVQQQSQKIETLSKKPDRKNQVLSLLQSRPYTIAQLAEVCDTTPKNISSILSYLRKENYTLVTNPFQYKFILKHPYFDPETNEAIDPLEFKD